jgi:hypothetical protein
LPNRPWNLWIIVCTAGWMPMHGDRRLRYQIWISMDRRTRTTNGCGCLSNLAGWPTDAASATVGRLEIGPEDPVGRRMQLAVTGGIELMLSCDSDAQLWPHFYSASCHPCNLL